MDKSHDRNRPDVIKLTEEAVELAKAAVYSDSQGNNAGVAYDYYDKAILNIDEVLGMLTPFSQEWKQLYEIRIKYDDRMEILKDGTSPKFDFLGTNNNNSEGSSKHKSRKKESRLSLEDLEHDLLHQTFSREQYAEEVPDCEELVSFWQLRAIKRSIETGGFISEDIFVPKTVWTQSGVKFSGLSIKTSAYQSIIGLINEHCKNLSMKIDSNSIRKAQNSFKIVSENLLNLQNQLSKPFPYIKEVTGDANDSPKKGQVSKWTTMMSSFSKQVIKIAEVGYQRLGTIAVKISEEDLASFATLTADLCGQCMVFEEWFLFLDDERLNYMTDCEVSLEDIESTLSVLRMISLSLGVVLSEMMVHDLEVLLERYMGKLRKSFSRMYWDDEDSSVLVTDSMA